MHKYALCVLIKLKLTLLIVGVCSVDNRRAPNSMTVIVNIALKSTGNISNLLIGIEISQ